MQQCPICKGKKIWKYGSRVGRKGLSKRLLCRKCGHLWEVLEEALEQDRVKVTSSASCPDELNDYFKELMGKIVDDIERDIPLEEAGWCLLNEELVKRLLQTGLCEDGEDGIRLVLSSSQNLPRKLTQTDEGDIILDINNAVKLSELLSQLSKDSKLLIGMEYAGLIRMLQTSNFPVLPSTLFEEEINPEIWFTKAPMSAYDLASDLAEKVWGTKSLKDSFNALEDFNLPIPNKEKGAISDKMRKILKWNLVPEIVNSEILEILGFLWYSDFLMINNKIKYLDSSRIVQKNVWDILELLMGKGIQEIEEELFEMNNELESKTIQMRDTEEIRVTDWHDVVRLPW